MLRSMAALLAATLGAAASAAPDGAERGVAELASLPLDTLLDLPVSGASKFAQRMSDTPASVTVIGAAEIRALGHRTLADVLRTVRGLWVSDDHSYSYLGVRGFFAPGDYNTRVLLLVDGNRVNDNVYDQAYLGSEFPLDLDLVERVEFIPGPGSAVYGANALFGVVNVVTRRDIPRAAALSGASGNTRQLRLGDSLDLPDGTRLQWSASRRLSAGQDYDMADPATGAVATARGTDYERRSSVYLRAEHGDWRASVLHAERLKGAPVMLDTVFGDPRNFNRDEHSMADLSWHHALGADDTLDARWFAGHYRFQGQYVYDVPPVTLNQDVVSGQWWGGEARWFSTRLRGHKLVLGLEFQQSTRLRQKNLDLSPPGLVYLDDVRSAHRAGVFAEDQIELAPQWSLTAGARWDHTSGEAAQFDPRLALLWRAQPTLVVKLIHGSAFRPPNAYEAYYHTGGIGGYKLNPALQSETVSGDELAVEWRPVAGDRLSASAYRNRARRLLVLSQDPADDQFVFRNLGAVHTEGLELEAERVFAGGARVRANVTFQHADDDAGSGEAIAPYAPRRMAKLMAVLPLAADWSLGAQWQGVSRRGPAPGYGTLDLHLSQALPLHGAAFSIGVQDLLDRRRVDPGADVVAQPVVPQQGRSFEVRLDWAF